jgi:hypothetical protein
MEDMAPSVAYSFFTRHHNVFQGKVAQNAIMLKYRSKSQAFATTAELTGF